MNKHVDSQANLPISFSRHRHVSMFTLEVSRINTTKNKLTSLLLIWITIEPKWKYRILNKTLFNHFVPVAGEYLLMSNGMEIKNNNKMIS